MAYLVSSRTWTNSSPLEDAKAAHVCRATMPWHDPGQLQPGTHFRSLILFREGWVLSHLGYNSSVTLHTIIKYHMQCGDLREGWNTEGSAEVRTQHLSWPASSTHEVPITSQLACLCKSVLKLHITNKTLLSIKCVSYSWINCVTFVFCFFFDMYASQFPLTRCFHIFT